MSRPDQSSPVRAGGETGGVRERLTAWRARIRALPGGFLLWRAGITISGVGVVILGIILLPLPGPGWLIIFAGLGLLATEYQWASRLLLRARAFLSRWTAWVAARSRTVQLLVGLAGLLFLAALAVGSWWLYQEL